MRRVLRRIKTDLQKRWFRLFRSFSFNLILIFQTKEKRVIYINHVSFFSSILHLSILRYKCLNVLPIYICSCILVWFAKILEPEESRVRTMCTSAKNGLRFAILRFHYESAQLKIVKMTWNCWLTVKNKGILHCKKPFGVFSQNFATLSADCNQLICNFLNFLWSIKVCTKSTQILMAATSKKCFNPCNKMYVYRYFMRFSRWYI